MTKQHSDSLVFTIVSLIGSFIIILISLGKQFINLHHLDFPELIKKGDVYIICASMAITAIYSFYTFKNEIKNGWPTFFFWISLFNYTASLVIYLLIPPLSEGIDDFWIITSIAVFIINMLITYLSSFYQNINTDVISDRNRQTDELQRRFSKAQEEK